MEVNVTRQQGEFRVDAAFEGVSSGVTALYGPSGAGKTSIINMVAGLMRPDAGRIVVNGLCLFDSSRGIDLPPERRRIGYVFQDGRLLPHLSVRANLKYGMRLTPAAQRFVFFDAVAELLGIRHLLGRRPARLSGGEKQRVAIGRALLTSPAMLLMDEPLASLDAARKAEVLPFVARLSREFAIPILYVSHVMDEILNLADRLVVVDAGRVAACGAIEDVVSDPELRTLFRDEDHGSVIRTVVDSPLDDAGVSRLRFGDCVFIVPPVPAERGTPVRVRIPARHVAVALSKTADTSIQNIFPARIQEIRVHDTWFADVCMDIGCPLWARITRRSLAAMHLTVGQAVYALIKTVSIMPGPLYNAGVSLPDHKEQSA